MRTPFLLKRQTGSVILAMLAMFVLVAGYMLVKALNDSNAARDQISSDAMAKAKEALIGSAATYHDSHADVNGYLMLPDLGSSRNGTPLEGATSGNFAGNGVGVSVLGRLPWRALGLPALRDRNGECLWYAVSGSYQGIAIGPTALMNWDTLGEFDTFTSSGTSAGTVSTVGANLHLRPAAVIFSPGTPLAGQSRTTSTADAVPECGGNYGARNYLDSRNPNALINNIRNYFTGTNNATGNYTTTPKSLIIGKVSDATGNVLVNDQALVITPDDIFRSIKRRTDFAGFVGGSAGLLTTAVNSLNGLPPPGGLNFTTSPPTDTGGTMVGSLEIGRVPTASCLPNSPLMRWRDNLLYARCTSGAGCLTVNGATCRGVVIFSGERNATQVRATNAQRNTWSNYLEGAVLTAFTSGSTTFTGASAYATATPSVDVLACIPAPPPGPGSSQVTFASNFGDFTAAGTGVSTNAGTQSVTVSPSAGASGGCFWYPTAIPLSGKTLRAYYNYTFTDADTRALTGSGPDHGNGFSLSFLRGDVGAPASCGVENDMGVLSASTSLGNISLFVETDVHRDNGDNDPAQNHTAIMLNGSVNHPAGTVTAACNGTARGCAHTPANKFEESPTPQPHNQRVEIHTGYTDAACSTSGSGSYALVKAWVDCAACSDTSVDFAPTPTILRCIALDPAMDSIYFGFTGGFSTGGGTQGVVIQGLDLRTQ